MQRKNLIETQNMYEKLEDFNKTRIENDKNNINLNLNKNSLILEKKNLEQKPKNKQPQRSEKIANTYQRRKKRETKENLFVPKADRPNKKEINNFTIDDVLRKISEFKQIRSELVNKMANINKTKEEHVSM